MGLSVGTMNKASGSVSKSGRGCHVKDNCGEGGRGTLFIISIVLYYFWVCNKEKIK